MAIDARTVLVLGAGASMPFGFPSGQGLLDLIVKQAPSPRSVLGKNLLRCGISQDELQKFSKALQYANPISVDAFLEYRQEWIKVGKLAIAAALIPFEDESRLFADGDWYKYLFNALRAPFEDFGKNKLAVITYNYDRSFQFYFLTRLLNTHY